MKLKKILAGTLAATLVMTGVPNAGFTVFAETDVLSDTGASDEGITALAAEDAMPAPYGYQNLPLSEENVTITSSGFATSDKPAGILSAGFVAINGTAQGGTWINFKFATPQKVAGVLYYLSSGQINGYIKNIKVEVKTSGSDAYTTVYENAEGWAKENVVREAVFTPVSEVTDVKVSGTAFNGNANYMQIQKMRIMTAPESAGMVTATAVSENETLGTAMADVSDAKAKAATVQVMPGVSVKY